MQSPIISKKRLPRLSRGIILSVFLIGLPACQSPPLRTWVWTPPPAADSSNVVYRPIFTWLERPNPLYLSNYAGDDQSPMRPRRNARAIPVIVPADSPPRVTVQQGAWDSE